MMFYAIILGIILLTILIYWWFSRGEISNDELGIVLDNEACFRINEHCLKKCSAKKALKTFKCSLIGGKFLNGELVLNTRNEILWLDRRNLQGLEYKELPFIKGKIAWIDFHKGGWWICDVFGANQSRLYAFDDTWNIIGFWRLPISEEIKGGCFGEDVLYVTTDKDLYMVSLPDDQVYGKVVNIIEKPIKGNNFSIEKDGEKTFIWGLKGSKIARVEI